MCVFKTLHCLEQVTVAAILVLVSISCKKWDLKQSALQDGSDGKDTCCQV